MNYRYKKSRKVNKATALGILVLIGASVVFPVMGYGQEKEPEVLADIDDQEEEEAVAIGGLDDIEVIIRFPDESTEEPFSSRTTYLEEYKNTPEWNIPDEYRQTGGCLPESVQVYLYNLCEEKSISYPLMLALIEAESGYRYNAESPDGKCVGYCMINEEWHSDRMERLGVADPLDPYGNIAVAVDYLTELFGRYEDVNFVLMCYNFGPTRANELLEEGKSSSEYSRGIVQREQEISAEIYGM